MQKSYSDYKYGIIDLTSEIVFRYFFSCCEKVSIWCRMLELGYDIFCVLNHQPRQSFSLHNI